MSTEQFVACICVLLGLVLMTSEVFVGMVVGLLIFALGGLVLAQA